MQSLRERLLRPVLVALLGLSAFAMPVTAKERSDPTKRAENASSRAAAQSSRAKPRQPKRTTSRSRKKGSRRRARTPIIPALRFTTPRDATALTNDLRTLLDSRTRRGTWGAMVVSLSRGDTLFARNPDTQMLPASTMKLFTSALAFERLGPDHTFSTDVLRDGSMEAGGVVRGNLILRGDGDPSMSPRFVQGGPDAAVTMLAQFVDGAGVTHITGDLIADASAFESRRIPDGWLARYAEASYAAPFSALSLNENIVIVVVSPQGARGGVTVALEPATRGLTVTSTARTVPGSAARLSIHRVGENRVMVSGTIGSRASTRRYQLVVGDPALFTAGAFRAALESRGIVVDGDLRVGRTPPTATVVARLRSPSLDRLVSRMNRESINLYAELLWRDAARGIDRDVVGSAENANALLQKFLVNAVGTTRGAVTATDGSGLSVLDRVTTRSMVQLLAHAHKAYSTATPSRSSASPCTTWPCRA